MDPLDEILTTLMTIIQTKLSQSPKIIVHKEMFFGFTEARYRTSPKEPSIEVFVVNNNWNGSVHIVVDSDSSLIKTDEGKALFEDILQAIEENICPDDDYNPSTGYMVYSFNV